MGFIEIRHQDGKLEVLGDENQWKKATGQPYRNRAGHLITEDVDIDRPEESATERTLKRRRA